MLRALRLCRLLCITLAVMAAGEPSVSADAWPIGVRLPDPIISGWKDPRAAKVGGPHVHAWVPEGDAPIRAVMLIANNTDLVRIGEHGPLRAVAARQRMAIVYLRTFATAVIEQGTAAPTDPEPSFAAVLDAVSQAASRAEIARVPWVVLGKSSRGSFVHRTAWWFPDRVVAGIAYHGETPPWPPAPWARDPLPHSILHLNIQGLTEWDGSWYRHVRPHLLNYNRSSSWLAHQTVIYGVDHGYYMDYFLYPNHGVKLEKDHRLIRVTQVWDYIAAFVDRALALRLPDGPPPLSGTTALRPVLRDSGWLVHPRAPEELLGTKWFALRRGADGAFLPIPWPEERTPVFDPQQGVLPPGGLIRRAVDVPEPERGDWMWLPDRETVAAWLALHDIYRQADRVLPP